MDIQVIEWPQVGSAARYPMGGWYVVEYTEGRGYFPLEGPFRERQEAEDRRTIAEAAAAERAAYAAVQDQLISDAAEAIEVFGEDELERAAAEAKQAPARCRGCGVQAAEPNTAERWYCPDCLDQGRDVEED